MKKLTYILCLTLVAGLMSCSKFGGKAQLDTELDSLAYAVGLARTEGLGTFLTQNGIDSTTMDVFMAGFMEGVKKNSKDEMARTLGKQVGQMVSIRWVDDVNIQLFDEDSTQHISRDALIKGFIDGAQGNDEIFKVYEASSYTNKHMTAIREAIAAEKYADNKAASEKFIEEKAQEEGVIKTESGLLYKVITMGTGPVATKKDKVEVHYRGITIEGKEFDSSYKNNKPSTFRVTQVVKGWQEALEMMPEGSEWELYVPYDLAYGSQGKGIDIKPFSALTFKVRLLKVVPKDEKKPTKKK